MIRCLAAQSCFHFAVAKLDMTYFCLARKRSSLLQVILQCAHLLPIKTKAPGSASCGRPRCREEKKRKKKSLWEFVLGCSRTGGAASSSAQQREREIQPLSIGLIQVADSLLHTHYFHPMYFFNFFFTNKARGLSSVCKLCFRQNVALSK